MMQLLYKLFNIPIYYIRKTWFHLFKTGLSPEAAILLLYVILFLFFVLLAFYLRKKYSLKKRVAGVLLAMLTVIAPYGYISWAQHFPKLMFDRNRPFHERPLVCDDKSTKLTQTQIVPTLDTPLQPGKNAIWCASFQGAWKALQNEVAQGPVRLEGADDVCARLNDSPVPEVPKGALYTAAGWVQKGIIETIQREKAARFPGSATPDFSEAAANSFVAYGYLETKCKFTISYFDSIEPVTFTDSAGNQTPIRTFGLRNQDCSKYFTLRKQIEVLVAGGSLEERPEDFAVDLCRDSKETQVVFARVPFAGSLKDILAAVEADIAMVPKNESRYDEFGPNNILLVPELAYRVVHEFGDLETRSFLNESLAGQRMDVARQEVMFRLDRSGTELMSESSDFAKAMSFSAIGDKPFLIYLKKRGAAQPYFVMWVDNSELLMKWE